MLCGPDQSAGLLLSYTSSALPLSILTSLTASSSSSRWLFLLSSCLFHQCLRFDTFSPPCMHHHFPLLHYCPCLLVTASFHMPFFHYPKNPSVLFTLQGVRNGPHPSYALHIPRTFLSPPQLRVRDCVHSVVQLSPNRP